VLHHSERRNSPTGTKNVHCCQFYRASFVIIGESTAKAARRGEPTI
jgi:hypothetical protein